MSKLPEYADIASKQRTFKEDFYERIDNPDSIRNVLKRLENSEEKFFFRGMKEARYKLYTSGQRAYIQNEYEKIGIEYNDFFLQIIDNLRKDKNLCRYNKAACIKSNDAWAFSYLQHYGAPTPYLDFTKSPDIALYFANEGSCFFPSDNEIDNYFSLYYIKKKDDLELSAKYRKVDDIEKKFHGDSNRERIVMLRELMSINKLNNFALFYISGANKYVKIGKYKILCNIANRNMIAQQGILLYNASKDQPIENLKDMKNNIHCIDIHKSLLPMINNEFVIGNKITHDVLFPDEYKIARKAYSDFQRTIR